MARILLAWELGAGLGHLVNVVALHGALTADGHRCDLVVQDVEGVGRVGRPEGARVLQAPMAVTPASPHIRQPVTHAEVLHNCGFDTAARIEHRMRAWRDLYALLEPDALVCDHAPSAILAARGTGIRTVHASNTFSLPPDTSPLAPIRKADAARAGKAARIERRVLEDVNAALAGLGLPALAALHELFSFDVPGLLTFQELDPFPRRNRVPEYWGPVMPRGGTAPEWPAGAGGPVFVYVRAHPGLAALFDCLYDSGRPVLIHAPETDARFRRRWEGENLRFAEAPLDPLRTCREAALTVTHSGVGMGTIALLAGCPALLLPLHAEQALVAAALARTGAALAADLDDADTVDAALGRLLHDGSHAEAAKAFAARHAGHGPGSAERAVSGAVRRLLS